jgi:hypothetical protein
MPDIKAKPEATVSFDKIIPAVTTFLAKIYFRQGSDMAEENLGSLLCSHTKVGTMWTAIYREWRSRVPLKQQI